MLLQIWKHCRNLRFKLLVLLGIIFIDAVLAAFSISLILPITNTAMGGIGGEEDWITKMVPEVLRGEVKLLLFFLAFVLFLKCLVTIGNTLLSMRYTENLRMQWQIELCRQYILQPFHSMNSERRGSLINDAISETNTGSIFVFNYLAYFSQIIMMLCILAMLASVNWVWLTIGAGIGAAGWIIVGRPYFAYARSLGKRGVTLAQDLSSIMFESLSGIKDIKISNSEQFQIGKINELAVSNTKNRKNKRIAESAPVFANDIILALAVVAVAIYVPSDLDEIKPIMPQIALFIVAISRMVAVASTITSLRFKVMSKFPSFLQVAKRMESTEIIPEDLKAGEEIKGFTQGISIRNLGFGYDPAHPVFSALDLELPRGKTICLVGPSGAGKTTLVDLLVRLYEPTSGEILCDGRNVRDFSLRSWRRMMGYVPQEPIMYYGTMRENLTLGHKDVTEEDIRRACEIATADEFINELPQGLETMLTERGNNLSGGQKKRLALARAIAHKARVIILDETTGAIQEAAERALIERLRKEPDLTVLIISHRESTRELADITYAIEGGRAHLLP